ncbi:MAG: hypothetical protein V4695_06820 [Pseudomonadota bacterium]
MHKPTPGLPVGVPHGQSPPFQGAVFGHAGTTAPKSGSIAENRSSSRRLPIAGQKKRPAAGSAGNVSAGDDPDVSLSGGGRTQERSALAPIEISLQRNDGDGQSDSQPRDEKRFQNIFALPPRSGKFTASNAAAAKAQVAAATPLPPMQSLTEVVKFLHGTLQSDPSGLSARAMMKKISQAVLRNEISLQTLRKSPEARSLLVEAFGKGYKGSEPLSPLVKKLHVMLPIWLLSLGKTRTGPGRLQAAARLSLPRTNLTTE